MKKFASKYTLQLHNFSHVAYSYSESEQKNSELTVCSLMRENLRELRENLKHKIRTFEGCLLWSGLGTGWLPVIWWSTPKRE